MVQKLGVSPVNSLHSLAIFSCCIVGAEAACAVGLKSAKESAAERKAIFELRMAFSIMAKQSCEY
jgi:hypothetical protein